jgi:mRNA interferase MazF
MTAYRGEIWLVNFNPIKKSNEIGKTRPALVLQNNELNSGGYPTTIVLPLTTDLINDAEPLRYRVLKKDKLEKDSDILIAHIRSIDNSRFIEKLSSLNSQEMQKVKNFIDEIIS